MVTRSVRKIRPRRKIKVGGNTRSVISRISSFKPKSLITIGGKRKYRKSYRKVKSGGKSRKSYRKVKSGGRRSKKSYKKSKSGGGRRRTKRSKSKRT